MVDKISIQKLVNGYMVTTDWYNIKESNSIYFKDMPQLVKHLDDCFAKPLKDLTYETKIKDAN
jgi:hypothetical protein